MQTYAYFELIVRPLISSQLMIGHAWNSSHSIKHLMHNGTSWKTFPQKWNFWMNRKMLKTFVNFSLRVIKMCWLKCMVCWRLKLKFKIATPTQTLVQIYFILSRFFSQHFLTTSRSELSEWCKLWTSELFFECWRLWDLLKGVWGVRWGQWG